LGRSKEIEFRSWGQVKQKSEAGENLKLEVGEKLKLKGILKVKAKRQKLEKSLSKTRS
jgi:hypothetical protein